jgi:hypothetical protein
MEAFNPVLLSSVGILPEILQLLSWLCIQVKLQRNVFQWKHPKILEPNPAHMLVQWSPLPRIRLPNVLFEAVKS